MEEETSEDQWTIVKQRSGTSIRKSLVWRVGKKIVITGIVVSSAPFVLPPLIVGSSIGLVLSVPFGMLFVGYACTQKVMSMLLSGMRVQQIDLGGREEEEEEDFEEDVKGRLEMRIELVEDVGKEESGCIGGDATLEDKRGSVEEDEMVDGQGYEAGVEEKRDEGIVVEEPTSASKQRIQNQQESDVTRVSEEGIEDTDESLVGRGYEEDNNVKEDDEGIVAEELGGGNDDKQEVDNQLGGSLGSGLEEVMGDMDDSVTRKGKEDDYNVKDDVELRNVDEVLNEEVKQDEEIVANEPVGNQFDSIARGSEEGMDDMGGNVGTKEDHNVKEDERLADVNGLVNQEVKRDEEIVAEAPVGENNDEQEVEQLGVGVSPRSEVEMGDMDETIEGREHKDNYNTIEDDKEVLEEENNDEGIVVEELVGGIDGKHEEDHNQLVEKDEVKEKSGGNENYNDKDDHKLANAKEMTALGMVVGGALGGGENEQKVENPFWHKNITRDSEEGKENVDEVIKGMEEYDIKNDEKSVDAKKRKKYQKKKDKKKKMREEEMVGEEPVCGNEQGNGAIVDSVKQMESNDETKEGRGHQENFVKDDDEVLDAKATAEKEDEKRDAGIAVEEPLGAIDVKEEEKPGKEVKQFVGGKTTEENEKAMGGASGGIEDEPVKETTGMTQEYASRECSEQLKDEKETKQNEYLDEPEARKVEMRGGEDVEIPDEKMVGEDVEIPDEEMVGEDVEIPDEEMVETINEETKPNGNSQGGKEKAELDFSFNESKGKEETPMEEKDVVIGGSGNKVNGGEDMKIPEEETAETLKDETKPMGNSQGGEGKAELDFSLGESKGKEEAAMEEREVVIERSRNKVNGGGDMEITDEKAVETAKEETEQMADSQGAEKESKLDFSLGESKGKEAPMKERDASTEGRGNERNGDITTQGNENGVIDEKLGHTQAELMIEGKKDNESEDSLVVKEIPVEATELMEETNVGHEDHQVDKEIPIVKVIPIEKHPIEVKEIPILKVTEKKFIPVKEHPKEAADESEQYMSETDETTEDKDPQVHVSRPTEVDSESQHESTAVSSITEEHGSDMGEESVDSVAPRERDENQAADSALEVQTEVPSEEVLHHEEKLWGLIDSMRKIVGCKSPKHSTFYEEIRALYVFTGVEPPAAFKNPVDLDEVDDRLRLLMAIVGVK